MSVTATDPELFCTLPCILIKNEQSRRPWRRLITAFWLIQKI